MPFPSPGDLPDPGTEPRSPALQADSLLADPPRKPREHISGYQWGGGRGRENKRQRECETICPFKKKYVFIVENGGNLIIKGTVNPCSLLLFPGGKEPACQCRRHKRHLCDPGLGRFPGGGHGNPLQYSYLENPLDRGVWQATVHRVAKSQTRLKQLSKANKIVMF